MKFWDDWIKTGHFLYVVAIALVIAAIVKGGGPEGYIFWGN